MSKPNWPIFQLKHKGKEQQSFQDLCYRLFCKNYRITEGQFAYKNHKALETDCIAIDNESVGFQVKYYEPSIKLSDKQSELKKAIKNIRKTFGGVEKVHFYVNKSFGSGRVENDQVSEKKKELDQLAKSLNLQVIWEVESKLFIQIENDKAVKKEYFQLSKQIKKNDYLKIARTAQIQIELKKLKYKIDGENLNNCRAVLAELYVYQDFANTTVSVAALELLYDCACCVSIHTKPGILQEIANLAWMFCPHKMGKEKSLKRHTVNMTIATLFSLSYDAILRLENAECLWMLLEDWRHTYRKLSRDKNHDKIKELILSNMSSLEDTARRVNQTCQQDALELLKIYKKQFEEQSLSQPILPDALYRSLRTNYKTKKG